MCTDRAAIRELQRAVALTFAMAMAATMSGPAAAVDSLAANAGSSQSIAGRVAPNPMLSIDQNRTTVVDRIVADWGDALAGARAGLTKEQLRNLLTGMRADHLLAASLAGSLDGLRNVIANAIIASTPAVPDLFGNKVLGDTGDDLVYTPVTPCRLVETRGTFAAVYQGDGTAAHNSSPFSTNQIRNYTLQGANAVCLSQLPAGLNPSAMQLQVFGIPVSAATSGDIEILPQGSSFGSTATLIYLGSIPFTAASATTKVNLANNQIGVQVRGGGANVAIDLLGYFKAPSSPVGTVTNIATGTGLTGGPITTAGTISIANGGVGSTQLAPNAVTQAKLSPAGSPTAGQVLGSDGANLQWQTVSGGGGGVSAVTASAPLASSGGSTPNISLTGVVQVVNGGTGQLSHNQNGVLVGNLGGPVSSTAPSTEAQVLVSAFPNVPTWTSSPTLGGNLAVVGQSIFQGNVGLGTGTPNAKLHVLNTAASGVPPRVESWGTTGFAAGWDFYLTGVAKGYVGVADPSAPLGAGEMLLYGGTGTTTSLWAGATRALTIAPSSRPGNIGIGTLPNSNIRLLLDSGANDYGIYSVATVGNGVIGLSTQSAGVYGFSTNAVGVRGVSSTDSGVYGEASVAGPAAAGVFGRSVGNSGIGVIGQANLNNGIGVYGTSTSPSGFGMYASNTAGGRALYVEGNATQDYGYSGVVKALVEMTTVCCSPPGQAYFALSKCFNGGINSSSGNCGLTVSTPLNGVARIDFGVPISNRFFSVSAKYEATGNSTNNSGANYRIFNSTTMEVFTFTSGNSADTQARAFTLVMY